MGSLTNPISQAILDISPIRTPGARGSVVVKALFYKPDGRWFDTRWKWFLNLPNPSGSTKPWGLLSLQHKWIPET
jgi:hypothetical protein